ncbi:polygalacturonase-like [Salvia miltiorrhiza]|uniref:polygalacturonase-like n=1 Tax=Salvia miltiorrhiza TaxID=226208 RepID=UPI0025AC00DC|nr:polygalacturonase-like [Salvia miltiorrhiza]
MNVSFIRLTVVAPGDSPNTDGIHVARSTMVNIADSVIATGDDCVSMGDDLTQVYIHNVTCGPGHGISIGSLGRNLNERNISGIYVKNCSFIQTQNGVRIKTWPSAPAAIILPNLHFENLIMQNASNPIIIDQQYCPWNLCNLTVTCD